MRSFKVFIGLFAAGILALGAGVALASEGAARTSGGTAPPTETAKAPARWEAGAARAARRAETRRVSGVVTAVEVAATPPTMVVKVLEGKTALTVGVDVPAKTPIRQGKAYRTLSDIKAGDRVWMKYERTPNHLVAEDIHILKPYRVAAKS